MINNVVLTGRCVSTPELKTTQSGKNVTSFAVANETGYGENKKTNFITVVAWQKTAEFVTKYFKKGTAIGICGTIQTRKYQDSNGNNRNVVEVFANEIHFIESKKEEQQLPEGMQQIANNAAEAGAEFEIDNSYNDDELPF